MSSRFLLVAGAVLLTAWATTLITTPSAAAKDDPAAKQKARDELRKELKDKKYFVYFDLSYYVDAPKLKETRWDWKDPPPVTPPPTEVEGCEFFALWVPAAGAEAGIEFKVQKIPHYKMVGDKRQPQQVGFKSWGQTVLVSKIDEMAKGFYEDWLAESTEPIKDHCHEPKKGVKAGPAEWYATAVATDKELKKRVRKDWYVWGTTGAGIPCCWFATVTISDKFKDTDEVIQIAKNMMLQTVEIKDKRADN